MRDSRMSRSFGRVLCLIAALAAPAAAAAQERPAGILTLADAVERARQNYPAIRESRARAEAAHESVGVARTAYLPRLDVMWQANRATRNNVFGLLLPQGVVPPISGPVLGTSSYDAVWGTAAGLLLSWQAVDFGQRRATVDVARAQASFGTARTALTELDSMTAAADAFLGVLASEATVRAARANVDRLQVFAVSVRTLVRNQLRPGADESRAEAELAIARNQLSQAAQTEAIARASLADAIGGAGTVFMLDAGALAQVPDLPAMGPTAVESHPAARAESAAIEAAQARERALDRAYVPRLDLQFAFAGRGSGAEAPGQPPRGDGLGLQVPNWAVGATVTFPVLDVLTLNARKRVEAQNELAERARYDQTVQQLTTDHARAQALMTAAAEIARNTPIELTAARAAESRARARYSSGLANVTEVAEAQRLLAQAEADDAVARLGAWRAVLAAARAKGELTPFLERLRP